MTGETFELFNQPLRIPHTGFSGELRPGSKLSNKPLPTQTSSYLTRGFPRYLTLKVDLMD